MFADSINPRFVSRAWTAAASRWCLGVALAFVAVVAPAASAPGVVPNPPGSASVPIVSSDLSLTASAHPLVATIDRNVYFSLVISNAGPAPATNIELVNSIPAQTVFHAGLSAGGYCSNDTGIVRCYLGTMSPASTVRVLLVLRPEATGVMTNSAIVTTSGNESNPDNNHVEFTLPVFLPGVTISDLTVSEGAPSSVAGGIFAVQLNSVSAKTVSVGFATEDGSGKAGSDYEGVSGTLTFAPGETNLQIVVPIYGDASGETHEQFRVRLADPTNARLLRPIGVATIADDDPPANDEYTEATILNGATVEVTGFNANATAGADDPLLPPMASGKTVWWRWTSPRPGSVTVSTAGTTFPTFLAVYSQNALVAANFPGPVPQANLPLTFDTGAGDEFLILVDSSSSESGEIRLRLDWHPERPFVPGERLRADMWDTDGTIHDILSTNGVLYLAGDFDYVYPAGRKVAAYDVYIGQADSGFPLIHGASIRAIVSDGQGGWFLGGRFDSAGGTQRSNLVHVLPNNGIDPNFIPDPNGEVSTLLVNDGVLYVGGDFDRISGHARLRIAALDYHTGAVTSWNPGANGPVTQLRAGNNAIYAAGYFTEIGGQPRGRVAALDWASGLPTAWNPNANGAVLALQLQNERAFLGGAFTSIGGVLREGLASANLRTALIDSWNPNPSGGNVTALQLSCDTVYVGGFFTNLSGTARHKLGAVDVETGSVQPWAPLLTSRQAGTVRVWDLALAGDRLYVAGDFDFANGHDRLDVAGFDSRTGATLPWNPSPNGGVTALGLAAGKILTGFQHAPGGIERHNLAAFDLNTGQPRDWRPDPTDNVHALAAAGNVIYVGGAFTNISGVTRPYLAAVDRDTAVATSWAPELNNFVHTLAESGSNLYVGGAFTLSGGQSRVRLAAYDVGTGALTSWDPGADQTVRALAVQGNHVYAGGGFTFIGQQSRNFLAAIDRVTGFATPWNPNPNNLVRAVAAVGDRVYVGGRFTALGGNPHARLAAIDAFSGTPSPWTNGLDGEINALAISGSTLYAGGFFSTASSSARKGLAAIETSSGALASWDPGASDRSEVQCLLVADQLLHVGGKLLRFQTSNRNHSFASLIREGAPVLHVSPETNAAAGSTVALVAAAAGQAPFAWQWFFGGQPIANATNSALVVSNVLPTNAGKYMVRAANTLGAMTAVINLQVQQAPTIAVHPQASLNHAPGSDLALTVTAFASPDPIYQWRLNGVNIPGAVFPTLTLTNLQPPDSGVYHVVVANDSGAVNGDAVIITVTAPALVLTDNFSDRLFTSSPAGQGAAVNIGASRESGEPFHHDRIGQHSVWFGWTAPANGFATFTTVGSTFDTLLAAYTGMEITNLVSVASDDDKGGFLASRLTFQAVAGTAYSIAIDGLAEASGAMVLSWMLDTNDAPLTRIIAQPRSQSLAPGLAAQLTVVAAGPSPLSYQWFVGCRALHGATNALLVLPNLRLDDVGDYYVVVNGSAGPAVVSDVAAVEFGPVFDVVSQNKLEDLLSDPPMVSGSGNAGGFSPSSGGFVSVSVGASFSQSLNNSGSQTQPGEPNHCGVLGGASKWIGLMPEADGILMVDTIGSAIDTVLAVYQATNLLNLADGLVACDNNSAPDGVRSLVRFPVRAGVRYLIAVDGVNGERGPIEINWALGIAPVIGSALIQPVVPEGNNLEVTIDTLAGNPPPQFQWWHQGVALSGATNRTLSLQNLRRQHEGSYTVTVSNFAGIVSHLRARVTVDVPLRLQDIQQMSATRYQLAVDGNRGQGYLLQISPDLFTWQSVVTNQLSAPPAMWGETNAPSPPKRFYRVLPW